MQGVPAPVRGHSHPHTHPSTFGHHSIGPRQREVHAAVSRAGASGAPYRLHDLADLVPWVRPSSAGSRTRPSQQQQSWVRRLDADTATRVVLAWSVVPALVLALQPLLAGGAGQAAAGASLAWQGPLRDAFSFTVLLGVFITCEPAAAAASAVSAAGAALTLAVSQCQLPAPAALTAALLAAAAAVTLWYGASAHSWSRLAGVGGVSQLLQAQQQQQQQQQKDLQLCQADQQQLLHSHLRAPEAVQQPTCSADVAAWRQQQLQAVQQMLGVLGGGLLLQLCWSLLAEQLRIQHTPGSWTAAVAVGAAAVVTAHWWLSTAGAHNQQQLQAFKLDWPAWSATLLLILQPLQQLVQTAVQPVGQVLAEVSAGQLLLLVLANGLMVPRALHTRTFMWFTGTCSGMMLAAGQLLLLGLAACRRHLPLPMGVGSAGIGAHGLGGGGTSAAGAAGAGNMCGLAVAVALAWLWFSASVLHQGWRWILAGDTAA